MVTLVLAGIRESKASSVYLAGTSAKAIHELNSLFERTRSADWDANDGSPPSELAFENAKGFAQAIPDNWPVPDLDVDREGDFRFEWILAQKLRISVAIGTDAEIPYSWVLQEERGYGVAYLGSDMPSGVEIQMERLLKASRRLVNKAAVI